ncbi:2-phospho-L-lactate transferase [Methanobrevibacter filiformis]|uniref:2-phospho-L-lactate transferase n=1 Tax=Methanobrevibacter filiformis TaxID=55758 RepID=A0A166EUW3_9EURY|nr:2-phospho-L-lactate transferase [Methanobrevibacter filiformis]KZX17038.1 2-phospho-L-lactate transferase [Methanobrevibacter filiformis]
MITILSGGTGTPKLIQGIKEIYDVSKLNIIVNTLENSYFSDIYVAADIDTVLYTLSDMINDETWYGIKNDTFITHEQLNKLGCNELLRIGDIDRATKIQKTLLMKNHSLYEAVSIQKESLNIKSKIIPMSNESSDVKLITDIGELEFHDFLITKQCNANVLDIKFNEVEPSPGLIEAIENCEKVIIGPSNPITSILPIISMKGVEKALKNSYVVAVSPIIGTSAVSGPAGQFMKALGYEVSSYGVASIYSSFLDKLIIDNSDENMKNQIEKLIKHVVLTKTTMNNLDNKKQIAKICLE